MGRTLILGSGRALILFFLNTNNMMEYLYQKVVEAKLGNLPGYPDVFTFGVFHGYS
jgi:hypothetical protein